MFCFVYTLHLPLWLCYALVPALKILQFCYTLQLKTINHISLSAWLTHSLYLTCNLSSFGTSTSSTRFFMRHVCHKYIRTSLQ